jgi:hypothetical protein
MQGKPPRCCRAPTLESAWQDYGVKANLKTEALIDLLLNETKWDFSATPQERHCSHLLSNHLVRPSPPPAQRSASRRASSRIGSRPRGRSGGSMIVHESDEGDTDGEVVEPRHPDPEPQPAPPPAPNRNRKAKESQTRLGVGRPVIAGGRGARAVTKPPSISKQKGGKSKGRKPTEATIQEGRFLRSLFDTLS